MVIAHNLIAMNSQRQFNIVNKNKAKSTEKLSSGYRINRAADDAAGLAISEKMRRQIRGLTQASLNCQDGVSLCQVADGAMSEIQDMLDRCTELSVKSANGTLNDEDRNYIQEEINQIKDEIDAIQEKATFNGIYVLKGLETIEVKSDPITKGGLPLWVTGDGGTVTKKQMNQDVNIDGTNYRGTVIDFSAMTSANAAELLAEDTGLYTTCCTCDRHYSIKFTTGPDSVSSSGNHYIYEVNISGITDGASLVNRIISAVGSNPNRHYTNLKADGNSLIIYDNRKEKAPSGSQSVSANRGIIGPGVAYGEMTISKSPDIIIQAGADNDEDQRIKIELPAISCNTLGIKATSVSSQSMARAAIKTFADAKAYVSRERSKVGAYQNRLEHTINSLDNIVENTQAAESIIRDTDMATEMVRFSNHNIIAQVAQSMMAQANQGNNNVLTLLQ